ncbi:MAG: hypothetical protein BV458_12795 [Thermoplasmata archaeon M9B2D]|nr:MAG: hypothetical protein BV458_12795 [Thermoplasmata archaeon M9B2D]
MAMYMLYKTTAKSSKEMDDLRVQFQEIYKRHNVDIVGFWTNADAEKEFFYMSRYENEGDYKRKVEELHSDEEYKRLTSKVKEARMDFQSTRLIPKWVAE